MKKSIIYIFVSLFYIIALSAIFSFTSAGKKSRQMPVTVQATETTTQSTQAAVENNSGDEAISIEDNGNVPADKYRPTDKLAARVLYGTASYYANSFNGQQTSNGDIFSQQKMTGASNFLPLNEWVRVTNLVNGKSIIVKITDRMHPRMTRVIDLSKTAEKQLAYVGAGLAKVKIEPLGKTKPTV